MGFGSVIKTIGNTGKAIYRSGVLPEMARGALVAASNPTRGAVGTAGDIFGAIGAVDEDRQRRLALQREREQQLSALQRQAEEDERAARLNEARIEETTAQAEFNRKRAENAGKPKQQADPFAIFDGYVDRMRNAKGPTGQPLYSDQEAIARATSLTIKQYDPTMSNPRTLEAVQALAQKQLMDGKITQEEYDTAIKVATSAAEKMAESKAAGSAKGRIPFTIPKIMQGAKEYFQQDVEVTPDGKGVTAEYKGTGVQTRQPAPPQPRQPRIQVITGDDGKAYRVPVEGGVATPVEGFTPKKTGAQKQGSSLADLLVPSKDATKTEQTKPKVSVGQTVKLKSGKTVTVKKVNADGTFEY